MYYHIALKNKKFHSFNRFYLLSATMISLLIPFLRLRWFNIERHAPENINTILSVINTNNIIKPSFHFTWEWSLLTIATIICICLLIVLFRKILWIYKIKRNHPIIKMRGLNLIITQLEQAPFSFLSNLFWRNDISLIDESGKKNI